MTILAQETKKVYWPYNMINLQHFFEWTLDRIRNGAPLFHNLVGE